MMYEITDEQLTDCIDALDEAAESKAYQASCAGTGADGLATEEAIAAADASDRWGATRAALVALRSATSEAYADRLGSLVMAPADEAAEIIAASWSAEVDNAGS